MSTSAKVIMDSVSPKDIRLTTIEVTYPYVVHAQVMTHRVFSRNGQSNRAIPVKKLIKRIQENPYNPVFRANQKGMVAGKPVSQRLPKVIWSLARITAIFTARMMDWAGVHKETVNRLLLPYMHMTMVITSTEWENFFSLRIEDAAQPEIQELATKIKAALDNSEPAHLAYGEWHLPYVRESLPTETALKVSVARCARVSYLNHDNSNPNMLSDIELYENLITSKPIHGSPAEHQATPIEGSEERGITHWTKDGTAYSNNLKGYVQFRALLS